MGHNSTLCHLCLAIGAANQVSQISGPGLVVMCRLGSGWDQSTVCNCQGRKAVHDVQWSFILESLLRLFQISCKNFFMEAVSIKKTPFGPYWMFLMSSLRLFLNSISVSSYLDTCWVQNLNIYFILQKIKFLSQRFQEILLVWSSPHPENDSFSGSFVNGNL